MATRDRATRNLFFGLLTLSLAVGTGLIVPPPAHAAVCNSATVTLDRSASPGPQYIKGTPGHDVILGSQYADQIDGDLGNDTICGGPGTDTIYGGQGTDVILGDGTGSGADTGNNLYGGPGNDDLFGDIGDDTLAGGSGEDQLYGGPNGDDILYGTDDNGDNDDLDGQDPDATATGDLCYAGSGDSISDCP